MLSVTYRPEPADVADVMRAMSELRFSLRITGALLIATPLLLTLLPILKGVTLPQALRVTWPAFVACWGFFLIGRPIAYRMMASRAVRLSPTQMEARTVAFAEDAIHLESAGRSGLIQWPQISAAVETRLAVVLVIEGTKGLGLPKRAFEDEAQISDLRALLREKLGRRAKV